MDTESLKNLGWLLLWGGLFFVMMRYGCGAHMMRGGSHESHGGRAGSTRDPVCGMDTSPENAVAAATHAGQTYYFCSKSCRDKFELAPENYLNATGSTRGQACH